MTQDYINNIFHGDWIEVAKELPDQCVHMICTSPPYWGQRNYGVEGQLGLEKTPEEHIEKLVAGFRELRRILRDDGTLWVNYGDKYAGDAKWGGKSSHKNETSAAGGYCRGKQNTGLQQGDLMGLAWRLAFTLQADGWILRDDIVWVKAVSFCATYSGSTMPESVNGTRWERCKIKVGKKKWQGGSGKGNDSMNNHDGTAVEWADCPGCAKCEPNSGYVLRRGSWRPTRAHEYVFQFAKTQGYFCDAEAVKEEMQPSSAERYGYSFGGAKNEHLKATDQPTRCVGDRELASGRNLRDCWAINPQPWARAHYATFPEKLVEPIVKVSTSQKGVCPKCGAPWARIIDSRRTERGDAIGNRGGNDNGQGGRAYSDLKTTTLGWRPTCTCGAEETVPAVCYDPFMGSGTVAAVAAKLNRNYCGSELNEDYLNEQATLRVTAAEHGISIEELEAGQKPLFK